MYRLYEKRSTGRPEEGVRGRGDKPIGKPAPGAKKGKTVYTNPLY